VDCGRRGEEELVVFSAMQGLVETSSGVDWQKRGIDLGGDAGLLAEMGEIGGKAVTEVESGGRQTATLEAEALSEARLGIEVRGEKGLEASRDNRWSGLSDGEFGEAIKGCGSSAEGACDVEQVAWTSAGAKQRAATRKSANQHDVGNGEGRFRQITSGKRNRMKLGEGKQAVEEALDP
jgi:hypothetical protein